VNAIDGGWSLDCVPGPEPILFLSGAQAQARALACRLSEAGEEIRLTVQDRPHAVVGSLLYSPSATA
jgi:hypothetical protein